MECGISIDSSYKLIRKVKYAGTLKWFNLSQAQDSRNIFSLSGSSVYRHRGRNILGIENKV